MAIKLAIEAMKRHFGGCNIISKSFIMLSNVTNRIFHLVSVDTMTNFETELIKFDKIWDESRICDLLAKRC